MGIIFRLLFMKYKSVPTWKFTEKKIYSDSKSLEKKNLLPTNKYIGYCEFGLFPCQLFCFIVDYGHCSRLNWKCGQFFFLFSSFTIGRTHTVDNCKPVFRSINRFAYILANSMNSSGFHLFLIILLFLYVVFFYHSVLYMWSVVPFILIYYC